MGPKAFIPEWATMPSSEDYRQQAAECIDQSQRSSDLLSKALLLQLAQAWIELAEQVGQVALDQTVDRNRLTRSNLTPAQ
jgi:hypothetical protein